MADPAVIRAIAREGRRRKRPKLTKAALATGIVESGLENLDCGDADSKGWRQERQSLYPNPTNVTASVRRFFDEAEAADRGKNLPAAEIAARVQRPAAQYRGRYGEAAVLKQADEYLRKYFKNGKGPSTRAEAVKYLTETSSKLDRKAYEQADRRATLGNFIGRRNPNSLLLRTGILGGQKPDPSNFMRQVTERTRTTPSRSPKSSGPSSPGSVPGDLVGAAQSVDRLLGKHRLPITAKQEPGHASGGDHDPAVRGATARDAGGSEAQRKAAFHELMRKLGVKGAVYKGPDVNVTKNGLRWQVISRDHGTGPHLHVGIRKARKT